VDITRETVNQWLDDGPAGRDRQWLADRCGVKVSAVGNWLNKKGEARPIPAEHQITIRRLMEEDAAKAQVKPLQNLVLEFSDEEFTAIENAAVRAGIGPREWARCALNEAAEADMEALAAEFKATPSRGPVTYPKRRDLKVAEGEPLKPKRRAAGE
jgi:hypothetical protein